MYTVTRQRQWPDGDLVVEVSKGGIDYTNPDALIKKYAGEFEEFDDPRQAVETAIEIARQWQNDAKKEEVFIGMGATGGMTMPFTPLPLSDETFTMLREKAESLYEDLFKCDRCGEILNPHSTYHLHYDPDFKFCSEHCIEEYLASMDE